MTFMTRRDATPGLLSLAAGLPATTRAQPRPELLRIVCGYSPGGSIDIVCRQLAERLGGGRYAAKAVVENKPGAAGRLAVDEVKKAAADGSTMMVTPASVGRFDEFVRWCRANRADAQCGNAGAGSMPHFMALLLEREARVDLTHVPYRGGNAAMQAAAAGEVSSAFATEGSARALVQAGRLRVLATAGAERSAFFPQTPTLREQGLARITQREWFGAFMPGRTPLPVAQAAADAVRSALQQPDVRDTWERAGLHVDINGPAELQAAMRQEHDFWGPLVKASGFTLES